MFLHDELGRKVGSTEGDRQPNGGPFPPFTVHGHMAAVKFHEFPHQVKTDSASRLTRRRALPGLPEPLENKGEPILLNPRARVLDLELKTASLNFRGDLDGSFVGEFKCVRKKIEDDFVELLPVDIDFDSFRQGVKNDL